MSRRDHWTLEDVVTRADLADLPASPLQLAIARAADGRELGGVLDEDATRAHFGCEPSALGQERPTLVEIVAGVRAGKSFLAACAAIHGCRRANLSALKKYEVARFSIVAPTVDNAQATFQLLLGIVGASKQLNAMCVGEETADTLCLRRPDNRVVEICVVAASRGAVTLTSRWSVGFVFDEVALFGSEVMGAIVNVDELLRRAETRLVPGAQGWLISSPYGPSGLLYELWSQHFGKPGRVLIVHAPTRSMNPAFPSEQIEAIRARSPDTAAREYDASWIDATQALYSRLENSTRKYPLEIAPCDAGSVAWGMDPAQSRNDFTLLGCDIDPAKPGRVRVVCARRWVPSKSKPLDMDVVLAEVAGILQRYGSRKVFTDEWSSDAIIALAKHHGIECIERRYTQQEATKLYLDMATMLDTGLLELSPLELLLQDLRGVRKLAMSNGIKVDLPRTPDGRHSDFCPSLLRAVEEAPYAERRALTEAETIPPPTEFVSSFEGYGASLTDRADADDQRWGGPGAKRIDRHGHGRPGPAAQQGALTDAIGAHWQQGFDASRRGG